MLSCRSSQSAGGQIIGAGPTARSRVSSEPLEPSGASDSFSLRGPGGGFGKEALMIRSLKAVLGNEDRACFVQGE